MGSKSKRRHAQKKYNREQNKPVQRATTESTIDTAAAPIMTATDFNKLEKDRIKKEKKATAQKPVEKQPKEKKKFFLIRFFAWIGRGFKETGSELKKVHWPTFAQVLKSTGVVLGIVIGFGVVLFGIWSLLSYLFGLLI